MTNIDTITTDQIDTLRTEAAQAGDTAMVRTCERAIDGDAEATGDVVRAIRDAEAAWCPHCGRSDGGHDEGHNCAA